MKEVSVESAVSYKHRLSMMVQPEREFWTPKSAILFCPKGLLGAESRVRRVTSWSKAQNRHGLGLSEGSRYLI